MRRLAFIALIFLLFASFSFVHERRVKCVRASSAILYDDVSDGYVDSDGVVYSIYPQMSLGDWNTNAYAACFVKFNLSGVSGTLSSATLGFYMSRSLHDNITDSVDPLTNIGLGDCQVIHITDYGTLDASDLFATSIGDDPGVLLGSTSMPNIGYVSIDVKTAMQDDINNGRPWSAFMLKMSTNTDSDDRNDYWVFWTYEYGDTTKQPYISYELRALAIAKSGNAPTIDGSIGVGEWSDASALSSNDTQVLVKQDGTNLYIGFSTSGINPQDDLACGMFLDPNHDKGYELRSDDIVLDVFSNGTMWEGHVSGSDWGDPQNATGWTAKSSTILGIWQAEFNISYSKINVMAGVEKTLGALFVSGKVYDPLPSAVWPPGYDWHSQRETPEQWGELSSGGYYWIPEFPAFQILLILMLVTFLVGVALKKKGAHGCSEIG
jgi:hypothetical protein